MNIKDVVKEMKESEKIEGRCHCGADWDWNTVKVEWQPGDNLDKIELEWNFIKPPDGFYDYVPMERDASVLCKNPKCQNEVRVPIRMFKIETH